ncbi:MAG TPA: hypothetical protein VJB96_02615 [Patescibacteria group bacterium]|nr:hypothetical protein [Patescibacteria group bacterium]
MMQRLDQQFIATVAYADVFDYPLMREELTRWFIGNSAGRVLPQGVVEKEGYFVLSGRERIITLRRSRERFAKTKWKRITKLARIFRLIPTVMLVGVTGGLAMNNARVGDDIDLFFITRRGTLWITRMLTTLFAECLRLRRRPNDRWVKDKICLNMFISEQSLVLPASERDLFSAHEVLQMVPLWERGDAYRTFLLANRWVKDFLPNAYKEAYQGIRIRYHGQKIPRSIIRNTMTVILRLFEPIAKYLQLWYMRNKRTNEVIRSGMIRFHPRDARGWVREKFAKRIGRWNIPLDKFFYHR